MEVEHFQTRCKSLHDIKSEQCAVLLEKEKKLRRQYFYKITLFFLFWKEFWISTLSTVGGFYFSQSLILPNPNLKHNLNGSELIRLNNCSVEEAEDEDDDNVALNAKRTICRIYVHNRVFICSQAAPTISNAGSLGFFLAAFI